MAEQSLQNNPVPRLSRLSGYWGATKLLAATAFVIVARRLASISVPERLVLLIRLI
jgi:hypothetical protein